MKWGLSKTQITVWFDLVLCCKTTLPTQVLCLSRSYLFQSYLQAEVLSFFQPSSRNWEVSGPLFGRARLAIFILRYQNDGCQGFSPAPIFACVFHFWSKEVICFVFMSYFSCCLLVLNLLFNNFTFFFFSNTWIFKAIDFPFVLYKFYL